MATDELIIELKQGKLRGKLAKDVNGKDFKSFQGIPYAKPPVGHLRFKPPQPAEPWKETILDCTKERSVSLAKHQYDIQKNVGSEDCLYLNVYTPKISDDNKEKLPVMVWIHGGGFIMGSGSSEFYGPEYLITKNIILVTINYRLGYLGFLSLNDASLQVTGNAGLKDQVMALQWVKNNISKFGGDVNNITLFGESVGAASVHLHMLSPVSRGLFHKAIMQSGSALCPWVWGIRKDYQLVKALGCKSKNDREILQFLQDQDAEKILNLQHLLIKPEELLPGEVNAVTPIIEPKTDTAFLWETPEKIIFDDNFTKVPLIVGYNTHEGFLMLNPSTKTSLTPNFQDNTMLLSRDVRNLLGDRETMEKCGNALKQFYYGDKKPSMENIGCLVNYYTDQMIAYKTLVTSRTTVRPNIPVYNYIWSLDTTLNTIRANTGKKYKGANHADELGYLFKNRGSPETLAPNSLEKFGMDVATTYWTNFAKRNNPNTTETEQNFSIKWKSATNQQLNCINIGPTLKYVPEETLEKVINLWDGIYKSVKTKTYFSQILARLKK